MATRFSKCTTILERYLLKSELFHDGGRYHIETSPFIAPQINGLVSI